MRVGWVSALAARVPPPAAEAALRALALALALLDPGRTRAWRANVRSLGVGDPRHPLAAATPLFHHLAAHYEAFAMLGGRRFEVEIDGEEILGRALAGGRGLLVATAHVGSWHLGGSWLHERTGRPVHTVAGTQIGPSWTRELRLAYRRLGIRIHPRARGTARLLRALRQGGIVALQVDGDQHAGGGLATRGALLLARRARVPILMAVSERIATGKSRIRFVELLTPGGKHPAPAELTARVMGMIADRPEQWALFRPLVLSRGEA